MSQPLELQARRATESIWRVAWYEHGQLRLAGVAQPVDKATVETRWNRPMEDQS